MTATHGPRRLDDDEVRALVTRYISAIDGWQHRYMRNAWYPGKGSTLAADDAVHDGLLLSGVVRTSLGIGTDHFGATAHHLLALGPTLFALHTTLRTAIIGGAQAVWILSPDEQDLRISRAARVQSASLWNHYQWLLGFGENPDPDSFSDVTLLLTERERFDRLEQDGKLSRGPDLTKVVRFAAEQVFPASYVADCMSAWRIAGCTAHALSWETHIRAGRVSTEVSGVVETVIEATWSNMQADLGIAYAFLETGWSLLQRRGQEAQVHQP